MNYVPPGDPRLEVEAAREAERELQMKAETYARLREDDDGSRRSSAIRRALDRARAVITRRG